MARLTNRNLALSQLERQRLEQMAQQAIQAQRFSTPMEQGPYARLPGAGMLNQPLVGGMRVGDLVPVVNMLPEGQAPWEQLQESLTRPRQGAMDYAALPGEVLGALGVGPRLPRRAGRMEAANPDDVRSELSRKVAKIEAVEQSPQKVRAEARKVGITPTVTNPTTVAYPGIYRDPRELVGRAEVAPENPAMKRLFGVDREDLYALAEEGRRVGNRPDRPYPTAAKPKGAKVAERVMNPRNEQRILNILEEASKRPDLYQGMASWYTMDPVYDRMRQLMGPEEAGKAFEQFNVMTGAASPGSPVLDELTRGTAANMLAEQGRFDEFAKWGGRKGPKGEGWEEVGGHPYHKVHVRPMQNYLETGETGLKSAKVPSYILAGGSPETGFQTRYPVGDAHWSRLVGLPDVRNLARNKEGKLQPNADSATVPEMVSLTPWWQQKIADPAGLEPVPAQAVVWGSGANATGVSSPVGASKLELLSQQIMKTAAREGISPEEARDRVLTRRSYAGFADPRLLGGLALGGLGAAAAVPWFTQDEEQY